MKFLIETPSNSIFVPFKYVQFSQKLTPQENTLINFLRPDLKIFCDQCLSILYQEDVSIFIEETQQVKEKKIQKDCCVKCFCSFLKSKGNPDDQKISKGRYFVRFPAVNSLSSNKWRVSDDILLLQAIKKFGYGNWNKMSYFMQTHGCYINPCSYQSHFLTYFSGGLNLDNYGHNPKIEIANESSEDSNSNTSKNQMSRGQIQKKKTIKSKALSDHFLHWKGKEPIIKGEEFLNMQGLMNEIMSSFQLEDSKEHLDSNFDEENPLMYIPQRDEFLIEHDSLAQSLICNLEFNDDDNKQETRMKQQLLQAYNQKLRERKKRKNLALNHDLVKNIAQTHKKKQNSEEFFLNKNPQEPITAFLDPFVRLFTDQEEIKITKTLITNHYNVKEITGTLSWVKKNARIKLFSLHSLENLIRNTLENQAKETQKISQQSQNEKKPLMEKKKVLFEKNQFADSSAQRKLQFIQSQILQQQVSPIYKFKLDTKKHYQSTINEEKKEKQDNNQNPLI